MVNTVAPCFNYTIRSPLSLSSRSMSKRARLMHTHSPKNLHWWQRTATILRLHDVMISVKRRMSTVPAEHGRRPNKQLSILMKQETWPLLTFARLSPRSTARAGGIPSASASHRLPLSLSTTVSVVTRCRNWAPPGQTFNCLRTYCTGVAGTV